MLDLILTSSNTIGLMAICCMVFGALQRSVRQTALRRAGVGLALGLGTVLAMLEPLQFAPGYQADARGAFVGVAALFGGPIAAWVTITIAGLGRWLIGGAGAPLGMAVIAATGLAVWMWTKLERPTVARNWQAWLALSLMCALPTTLAFFLTPAPTLRLIFFIAALNVSSVLIFGHMMEREQRLRRRERLLSLAAATDELTGLPNRRAFVEYCDALEKDRPKTLALLMMDIDHFKSVNDRYGHAAGDHALRSVGAAISQTLGAEDFAARLGGEEFGIVLRVDNTNAGFKAAERLREACRVSYGPPELKLRTSVSIGGFFFEAGAFNRTEGQKFADRALYQAKASGRDQTVMLEPSKPAAGSMWARYADSFGR